MMCEDSVRLSKMREKIYSTFSMREICSTFFQDALNRRVRFFVVGMFWAVCDVHDTIHIHTSMYIHHVWR